MTDGLSSADRDSAELRGMQLRELPELWPML